MERNPGRIEGTEGGCEHIFCLLYSMGLIGTVRPVAVGEALFKQSFATFGEIPLGKHGVLPKASEYLVHPGLSDYIIHRNNEFLGQLNSINIIGDGREWRTSDGFNYVVMADIDGFRRSIMHSSTASHTFDGWWVKTLERIKKDSGAKYFKYGEGDKLVVADARAEKLLRICGQVDKALLQGKYGVRMRFAGHCGFWNLENEIVVSSDVAGTAARIEPLGEAGAVIISEQFRKNIEREDFFVAEKYVPYLAGEGSHSGPEGSVRISKSSEKDEFVRLWRYDLDGGV